MVKSYAYAPGESWKWKWLEFGQEKAKENKLDRERQRKEQQTERCIRCNRPITPQEYMEGRGFCAQCRMEMQEQSKKENSQTTNPTKK